jgi:Cu/Ag efflux pump CusA
MELILRNIVLVLPLALAAIAVLVFLLKRLLKNKNSTDIILLGIEITLTGGILLISKSGISGNGAVELILVFAGLSLSLAGLLK